MKIPSVVQSYGNFTEWVDFAYWQSCIGKGLRLQPAQQACFDNMLEIWQLHHPFGPCSKD